eukprot:4918056-Prymnesium_polylepis.1
MIPRYDAPSIHISMIDNARARRAATGADAAGGDRPHQRYPAWVQRMHHTMAGLARSLLHRRAPDTRCGPSVL